jgi:hypothetical protein
MVSNKQHMFVSTRRTHGAPENEPASGALKILGILARMRGATSARK